MWKSKAATEVSWFEQDAILIADRISALVPDLGALIADIGSGASVLIDELVARGYTNLVAVDLSADALATTKARLGDRASAVEFQAVSALDVRFDSPLALWHDRALFHFFTDPDDIGAYRRRVVESVAPGGYVVISTFADDGPEQCSGLPVARYSPEALAATFAPEFAGVESWRSVHRTPWGSEQRFATVILRRR